MMRIEVIPVLHNAYSPQRLIESARTVYGLNFKLFIATKASGSAAQVGVPEAQKLAMKMGKSFAFLPDLPDAIEILKPDKIILVVPKKYASVSLIEVLKEATGRVMIVFGGSEPGLSKKELELGIPTYIEGVEEDLGPVSLLAIMLYEIKKLFMDQI
ncbi:MAG: RecB-family nuclease [Thermofilaceae archaeon]